MKATARTRFTINTCPFGPMEKYTLNDSKSGMAVTILPEGGGMIASVQLPAAGLPLEILDSYSDFTDYRDNLSTSFKGSSLCPFPNRIAGGRYKFENKQYQLQINFPHEKNAIHGLVYDRCFSVIRAEANDLSATLEIGLETGKEKGFPFPYTLIHRYRLDDTHGFTCTTEIISRSDRSMPVAHGWHPYFRLKNTPVDQLHLTFPQSEMLELDGTNIPNGRSEPYDRFSTTAQIGDTALDSCFRLIAEEEHSEIVLENRKAETAMNMWVERGAGKYNYLQIYTPPHRNSIAIEPMTSAPDAFNNGLGLLTLAPGDSTKASWGIKTTPPKRS